MATAIGILRTYIYTDPVETPGVVLEKRAARR